jgi:hypothetical protein
MYRVPGDKFHDSSNKLANTAVEYQTADHHIWNSDTSGV